MAEDGRIGGQYQLRETPSPDSIQRTEWNVRDSDGTVVFTLASKATGGSLATIEFARALEKPCVHISSSGNYMPAETVQKFVSLHGIKRLNVAGSRESEESGIHRWVMSILEDAFFWGDNHPYMLGGPGEG